MDLQQLQAQYAAQMEHMRWWQDFAAFALVLSVVFMLFTMPMLVLIWRELRKHTYQNENTAVRAAFTEARSLSTSGTPPHPDPEYSRTYGTMKPTADESKYMPRK